jgi:hypothetical protein
MSRGSPAQLSRWQVIVAVFAGAKLTLHLAFNAGYGHFRDELYYLACADHLAWGYVDHPPLVAVFAWVARALFGTSTFGLRVLPAVAAAGLVVLTAALVRALGGSTFALVLACACLVSAPANIGTPGTLSMNVLEPLFWTSTVLVVVRAIDEDRPRLLLWLGPIVGIGFLNKHSMAWITVALAIGLVLSPSRRWLGKKELLIAAAVAALIALPHVVWQVEHGFPTLEFMRNAQLRKNAHVGLGEFARGVLIEMSPLSAPVFLVGLFALFFRPARDLARHRAIGIAALLVLALIAFGRGKSYYAAPLFPAVFAAGAVAFEGLSTRYPRLRWSVLAPIFAFGAVAAPLALPILSPERVQAYARWLGAKPPTNERHENGALPQNFADRFGWREMSLLVRGTVASLPPDERARSAVLAQNYGEASAIRFFGTDDVRVISPHNAYYTWGYGPEPPVVLVTIGFDRSELEPYYADVREVARFDHPLAMPYERDNPVLVCRSPNRPFDEIWRRLRFFI